MQKYLNFKKGETNFWYSAMHYFHFGNYFMNSDMYYNDKGLLIMNNTLDYVFLNNYNKQTENIDNLIDSMSLEVITKQLNRALDSYLVVDNGITSDNLQETEIQILDKTILNTLFNTDRNVSEIQFYTKFFKSVKHPDSNLQIAQNILFNCIKEDLHALAMFERMIQTAVRVPSFDSEVLQILETKDKENQLVSILVKFKYM